MIAYSVIHEALYAVLAAIPAIRQLGPGGEVVNVLRYIPKTISTSPLVYIRNTTARRPARGTIFYTFEVRLTVMMQDKEGAEALFVTLLSAIPDALPPGSTLNGVFASTPGQAWASDWATETYQTESGVIRACDFQIIVEDKSGLPTIP